MPIGHQLSLITPQTEIVTTRNSRILETKKKKINNGRDPLWQVEILDIYSNEFTMNMALAFGPHFYLVSCSVFGRSFGYLK